MSIWKTLNPNIDYPLRTFFEIVVFLLTIAAYTVCFSMLCFWTWFTNKLISSPEANWEEIMSLITKSSQSKFFTLMTVNPFVVALVCTITIVLTIWCYALFFSNSKNDKNTTKENL